VCECLRIKLAFNGRLTTIIHIYISFIYIHIVMLPMKQLTDFFIIIVDVFVVVVLIVVIVVDRKC